MKKALLAETPLHEWRRARALSQRDPAALLKANRPAVSKLEQRTGASTSSLRSYVEAVGGKLKTVAEFPEGEAAIADYCDVGEAESRPAIDG